MKRCTGLETGHHWMIISQVKWGQLEWSTPHNTLHLLKIPHSLMWPFFLDCLIPKMKALWSFKTGITHPVTQCHVLKGESLATPRKPQFCMETIFMHFLKWQISGCEITMVPSSIWNTGFKWDFWGWSLILWKSREISNEPRQTPHSCNSTTNQFRCSAVMGLVLEENLAIQHLEKEELTDQMMNWH